MFSLLGWASRLMADATAKEPKISIKVFIDKVTKRVVYAEADRSFVDILFSFMALPMGTIVRILSKHADKNFDALGSFNNLYQSLQHFPDSYFAKGECKFMLLNPRGLLYDHFRTLKLKLDDTEPMQFFTCDLCWSAYSRYCPAIPFSICNKAVCDLCNRSMNTDETESIDLTNLYVGDTLFVSNVPITFIVTDDLSVMPYTAADSIRLITEFGITDMSHIEERKLDIGCDQMLHLLRMALSLDSPLTHLVFGRKDYIRDLEGLCQGTMFDQCSLLKTKTSTCSKMLLEVSLQKSTGKVLFAEAKEDFVEFLFCLLSIPLGTMIGTLLNGASSNSCLNNIFKSISIMSVGDYLRSKYAKDMLVKPHFGQQYTSQNQLFPLEGTEYISLYSSNTYKLKDPRRDDKYLKPSGMFLVMDDLVITPSTSYSTRDALNKLKVKLDDIERHQVRIGLEEGLRVLEASLRSRSALTSIIERQLKK